MTSELPQLRIITISVEPGKDVEVNYDGFHFYEAQAALYRAVHRVEEDEAEDEVMHEELNGDSEGDGDEG